MTAKKKKRVNMTAKKKTKKKAARRPAILGDMSKGAVVGLSVREAAKILGVGEHAVRAYCRGGMLVAADYGGSRGWVIDPRSVARLQKVLKGEEVLS